MLSAAEWSGPVEGYVVNHLKKHHWKIARSIPWEDAIQEAVCVFLRCKRKYAHIEEAKHFMALFKTAWSNHFTDLCNEDTASRVMVSSTSTDEEVGFSEPVGDLDNAGMLATMIRQAPREVTMVLNLFLSAPQELLDSALHGWRPGGDKRLRANGSEQINKLLGLPAEFDSMKAVNDYFKP